MATQLHILPLTFFVAEFVDLVLFPKEKKVSKALESEIKIALGVLELAIQEETDQLVSQSVAMLNLGSAFDNTLVVLPSKLFVGLIVSSGLFLLRFGEPRESRLL